MPQTASFVFEFVVIKASSPFTLLSPGENGAPANNKKPKIAGSVIGQPLAQAEISLPVEPGWEQGDKRWRAVPRQHTLVRKGGRWLSLSGQFLQLLLERF
jgi:hypothetical protein